MKTIGFVALSAALFCLLVIADDDVLKNVNKIGKELLQVDQEFEMAKISPKTSKSFAGIINKIKSYKQVIRETKVQIMQRLTTEQSHNIINRTYLEWGRILCQNYDEALSQIGFEILGFQNNISDFKTTYVSESINIVSALIYERFDKMVIRLCDIDNRVTEVIRSSNVTAEEKQKIVREINDTISDSTTIKLDLYRVYLVESEMAHAKGQELSLIQKADTDSMLQMMDWTMHFIREFHRIISRFID